MEDLYDTVVVGAGVMGSATAYFLSKSLGKKVLLLEQFDFLHRRGSSHGDSRITRLTYPQDYYTFLMLEARALWNQAETESGMKVFTKTGGLDFGPEDNAGLQSVIAAAKKWNVPIEIWTASKIATRYPTLKLPNAYIGVYSEHSGVLNATKAVAMFQILARQQGAQLVDNAPVIEVIYSFSGDGGDHRFDIRTERGTFKARNCIVTAGAWTQKTLDKIKIPGSPTVNLDLPLQPCQTTVVYWSVAADPSKFSGQDRKFPVFIDYRDDVYGLPALEFPSLIKVQAHYGPPVDPDNRDFQPPHAVIESILVPYMKTTFAGVSEKPVRTESCMYTMTPDGDFIVDKVERIPGLFMGCGFSGHGFKLSPVVGRMLAQLAVTGENPYPDVAQHFRLNRFENYDKPQGKCSFSAPSSTGSCER